MGRSKVILRKGTRYLWTPPEGGRKKIGVFVRTVPGFTAAQLYYFRWGNGQTSWIPSEQLTNLEYANSLWELRSGL